jgi:anti-sigma factor RsiW
MTDHETLPGNVHREAALLPWYVNGTLSSEERLQVDRHVAVCSGCRAELDELLHLRTDLQDVFAAEPSPSARLAETVKARIAREAARDSGVAGFSSVTERFERWSRSLFAPRWVPGLAMLLVVTQGALLLWLLQQPAQEAVVTRSLQPAPVQIHVTFHAQATEEQIRTVLQAVQARVVDGPSGDGVYLVELPRDPRVSAEEKVRALLGHSEVVKSAGPLHP